MHMVSRGIWSGALGFILASVGSAIGLGNIWRFSYVAGENGGAAFLLVYVGLVILVGLPLMMAEFVVGRRGGGHVPTPRSRPPRRLLPGRIRHGLCQTADSLSSAHRF